MSPPTNCCGRGDGYPSSPAARSIWRSIPTAARWRCSTGRACWYLTAPAAHAWARWNRPPLLTPASPSVPATARFGPAKAPGKDRDTLLVIELSDLGVPVRSSRIALPGHPVPVGIAFSPDGSLAYVALSRDNALAVIDPATRKLVRRIDVGIAPFGVVAAKNGIVYVSNRGGRRPHANETVAPSSGSEVLTDPVTGSSVSGTVSVVDIASASVHEIPVGLAPSQMALSPDQELLAVADGHSDAVTLLDTRDLEACRRQHPDLSRSRHRQPAHRQCLQPGWRHALRGLRRQQRHRRAVAATAWIGRWPARCPPPGSLPPSRSDGNGALRVLDIKGMGNTADANGTFNSQAVRRLARAEFRRPCRCR